MGAVLSSVAGYVNEIFETICDAFRSGKTRRNPTMEEMEDHMRQNARSTGKERRQEYTDTREEPRQAPQEERRRREYTGTGELPRQAPQEERGQSARGGKLCRYTHITPDDVPTEEEYAAAKQRLQYEEGFLHFAIAGVAGSGKSSLLNAFLGQENSKPGAAPTGTSETTRTTMRYADPHLDNPFVWYDVPGAGTLSVPGAQYFKEQALYIFDAIFVVFDNRFTETDVAILKNCQRLEIPTYIVRSKALQHVWNVFNDMNDDRITVTDATDPLRQRAQETYIRSTRQTVRQNLEKAGLPAQRVYIVDKDILRPIIKGRGANIDNYFDEWDLLQDILDDALHRRVIGDDEKEIV
ncbi:hypothetical protein DAEQUDRAFT_690311 [Daedalea quercina L-15889]|uniref:IRG-type G domain-containing protein n=1 Tax=Daedalea quercina L-15889 TaxID=1314783 RepID=A0A165QSL4_9APHY|nr:hypothetical protein DAEQUDRAFT_690311 [Daedalea quercina L-15889]